MNQEQIEQAGRRQRRGVKYEVWTDEDGPIKRHAFAGGVCGPDQVQAMADCWARSLQCYVQINNRRGVIIASAGRPYDA